MLQRPRRPKGSPPCSRALMAAIDDYILWKAGELAHQIAGSDEPFTTPAPVMAPELQAELEARRRLVRGPDADEA
jgi:hypothetical protein